MSNLGYLNNEQYIGLAPGCIEEYIIIHETLHTLGFYHEQNRLDRDKYVTIKTENIKPGKERKTLSIGGGSWPWADLETKEKVSKAISRSAN